MSALRGEFSWSQFLLNPHDARESASLIRAWAQSPPPKYSAKVPPSITTPDTVQTRIGTLKFADGLRRGHCEEGL
jgi:hypothetical protein